MAREAGSRGRVAAAAIILAASLAVRLAASCDDFWLDEIWSWAFARDAAAAGGPIASLRYILTGIRHDNNHFLNTYIIYLLGPNTPWILYRIPAVLAGTATVGLAGLLAARRGAVESLAAMILTGSSFLLIQYSSEARGYAYVLFFAALSWLLARRWGRAGGWPADAVFSVTAVLGFLAHLTYAFCYSAILVWSGIPLLIGRGRRSRLLGDLARRHAAPLLFLAWLYATNLQAMAVGRGGEHSALQGAAEALSLAIGGPLSGPGVWVIGAIAALAFAASLLSLRRAGDGEWIFYLLVVAAAPLLGLAATRPQFVYPRYFLVPAFFLQLVVAHGLTRLFRQPRWGPASSVLLLTAIVAGASLQTARLLRVGRGGYASALARMQRDNIGPVLTIGSDHDFRNPLVLRYYQRRMPDAAPLAYYPQGAWPEEGPQWVVTHSQEQSSRPPRELEDPRGNRYRLVETYPYAGLSGWRWTIYHNERFSADARRGEARHLPTESAGS